jgi:hypothetical protein
MRTLVLVLVLCGACSKKAAEPPPAEEARPAPIPATEVQRGQDACKAYLAKVCACTEAAAKQPCELAKALPDAIDVGLQISANPESTRRDVLQAQDSVRKTMKECIEQTAKLPALGCP